MSMLSHSPILNAVIEGLYLIFGLTAAVQNAVSEQMANIDLVGLKLRFRCSKETLREKSIHSWIPVIHFSPSGTRELVLERMQGDEALGATFAFRFFNFHLEGHDVGSNEGESDFYSLVVVFAEGYGRGQVFIQVLSCFETEFFLWIGWGVAEHGVFGEVVLLAVDDVGVCVVFEALVSHLD